jgi:hypothetical protein
MACILPATWNVNFALVDEREKNRMREELNELGALISKLQLGDDAMSIKTYIKMEREEITELELNTDELVDVALGINYAQVFDLNVDAKRRVSSLSNFLDNSLHFGVNEIISFQKLVGNLDKMTVANLGKQHQRSLNSYFKSS